MSGKQHKRELKRQREEAREAARRKERQRTVFTGVIVAIIVAIGGVLVVVSLGDEPDPFADTDLEELLAEQEEADEAAPEEDAPDEPVEEAVEDGRPVACGAEEPPAADTGTSQYPDGPEQVLADGVDYGAVIETSCGTVVVDLDQDRAPETVNSFVFLAQEGFFDGLEIFRNATSIGALQTGAGTDEATWDIGYNLPGELDAAEEDGYPPGAVAMANRGDPDTGGSQFFFVYDENFTLEPTYARFGTVSDGLEVLEEIGAIPVDGETPQERVYMEQVTIQEG